MPIDPKIRAAVGLLATFKPGQHVEVTEDGRTHEFFVRYDLHLVDWSHGSYESNRITVTMGVGRYSADVTAERVAEGKQQIIAVDHAQDGSTPGCAFPEGTSS